MDDDELASATGLALAAIVGLIERPEPVPKGEVARCLILLAESAPADRPRQREVLENWARLLRTSKAANEG